MQTIKVSRNTIDASTVAVCVNALRSGGVVCYPTETFYALGIDFQNPVAVRYLYTIKGRAEKKAFPCIASDREVVSRYCDTSHPLYNSFASRFWPGPLTLILRLVAKPGETVAVRVSSHPVARQLAKRLDSLLVSTSANRSGEPAVSDPGFLQPEILKQISILIDAGLTKGGSPSTIVSLLDPAPRIVRRGAIPESEIMALL
jgi:L-threonylcarbamoyladenylate synthase